MADIPLIRVSQASATISAEPLTEITPEHFVSDDPLPLANAPEGAQGEDVINRTCFDRWFGPMSEGSMRTFVFALCNTAFGSGVLMLPWVYSVCGIPLATFFIVMSGTLSAVSLRMLANAASVTNIHNYDGVVRFTLGACCSKFVRGLIFTYCFGSVISYFIFLVQLTEAMFDITASWYRPAFIILLFMVLLLPAMLSLSHLRYFNLLAVMCLPVVVTCIISACLRNPHARPSWYAIADGQTFPTIIKCIAICFYAFSCHVSLFAAYGQFNNPLPRRMEKVLFRTVAIQVTVYCVVGISGFLAFGNPCPDKDHNDNCTPDDVLKASSFSGPISVIARLAMLVSLCVSIPVNVFAARDQIVARPASILIPEKRNSVALYTLCFLGSAAFMAVLPLDLKNVLSITGGFGAVTFMFTIPFLITVKLRKMRLVRGDIRDELIGNFVGITKRGVLVASALLIPAIVVGYAAGFLSIVGLFTQSTKHATL